MRESPYVKQMGMLCAVRALLRGVLTSWSWWAGHKPP